MPEQSFAALCVRLCASLGPRLNWRRGVRISTGLLCLALALPAAAQALPPAVATALKKAGLPADALSVVVAPVDASQLNIAGDDGLFDLSGLTASDPSVQFMGTLNEEISDAQQTNNIDGSATTDVYDTATPAPDDSTDGDSTDGDSTPSE